MEMRALFTILVVGPTMCGALEIRKEKIGISSNLTKPGDKSLVQNGEKTKMPVEWQPDLGHPQHPLPPEDGSIMFEEDKWEWGGAAKADANLVWRRKTMLAEGKEFKKEAALTWARDLQDEFKPKKKQLSMDDMLRHLRILKKTAPIKEVTQAEAETANPAMSIKLSWPGKGVVPGRESDSVTSDQVKNSHPYGDTYSKTYGNKGPSHNDVSDSYQVGDMLGSFGSQGGRTDDEEERYRQAHRNDHSIAAGAGAVAAGAASGSGPAGLGGSLKKKGSEKALGKHSKRSKLPFPAKGSVPLEEITTPSPAQIKWDRKMKRMEREQVVQRALDEHPRRHALGAKVPHLSVWGDTVTNVATAVVKQMPKAMY